MFYLNTILQLLNKFFFFSHFLKLEENVNSFALIRHHVHHDYWAFSKSNVKNFMEKRRIDVQKLKKFYLKKIIIN